MAQKVGEEATEVVIAALARVGTREREGEAEKLGKGLEVTARDPRSAGTSVPAPQTQQEGRRQRLVEEASDLLFHLMVLLKASGVSTADLASELSARHRRNPLRENVPTIPLPKNRGATTSSGTERSESEQDDQDPERIGR